jgi:hypothetical protein
LLEMEKILQARKDCALGKLNLLNVLLSLLQQLLIILETPNFIASATPLSHVLNRLFTILHTIMHTPRIFQHKQKRKLTLLELHQPPQKSNIAKSMDFSHARQQVQKWLLNSFSLPKK